MATISEARMSLKEQNGEKGDRFVRSFDRSRNKLQSIIGDGVRQVGRSIRDLKNNLIERLTLIVGALSDPFLIRDVPSIENEVRTAIGEFSRVAEQGIQSPLGDAFDLGGGVTATALGAVGVSLPPPTVSPNILTGVSAAATDVIAETGVLLGDRIMRQVRLAAAGQIPGSRSIREISNLIEGSSIFRGVRRRIGFGFQAEAIFRTEIGRIFSMAQQDASVQISDTIPDLRKRWVTGLRRRRGHREAESRYAPGGEIGPIPVKQLFRVTEFSRSDRNVTGFWTTRTSAGAQRVYRGTPGARRGLPRTDRMLHPRDPSASVGNVVNCTCLVQEVLPELERAADRALGVIQR